MPTFRNDLPDRQRPRRWELKRTPTTGLLSGIITAHDLTVCDTHWWGGQTIPCERLQGDRGQTIDDTRCPACVAKAGFRTHCYVPVFDPKTRTHFIFEMTENPAAILNQYAASAGSLRGCMISARRTKPRPNAPVAITCKTADALQYQLPEPPDVAAAMAVIWQIPGTALDRSTATPAGVVLKPDPTVMSKHRDQPNYNGAQPSLSDHVAAEEADLEAIAAKQPSHIRKVLDRLTGAQPKMNGHFPANAGKDAT